MVNVGWWARRLVSGRPHQKIGNISPYMWRWWVIPHNRRVNIYVHRFLRDDDDRALHDHPWDFISVVLRGCYLEQRDQYGTPVLRRRFSVAYRRATDRHRVALVESAPATWTLVITGPKIREWGFWCRRIAVRADGGPYDAVRFVPWREWDDATGCGEFS